MLRELRIQYPGAMYQVLNRGDQMDDIFLADEDRQRFLSTLEECCRKTDWQVHSYVSNLLHAVPPAAPQTQQQLALCVNSED